MLALYIIAEIGTDMSVWRDSHSLVSIKSTRKHPYFHNKYVSIQKRRNHKKAIIAIARKMLMSIYYMIKEGKNFQPVDYEQVVTRRQSKKLN